MIKDNTIYFGYGDILVGSSIYGLIFESVSNHYKIGTEPSDLNYEVLSVVSIGLLDIFECTIFKEYLNKVLDNEISRFKFKDYYFDFSKSNLDIGSIYVCMNKLDKVVRWRCIPLAC